MMRVKMLGMATLAGGLMIATVAQAAPAFDTALSAGSATEITPVQYYGYGYAPRPNYGYGYGESPQHYAYRQERREYLRARRAYRAERYYRYGY